MRVRCLGARRGRVLFLGARRGGRASREELFVGRRSSVLGRRRRSSETGGLRQAWRAKTKAPDTHKLFIARTEEDIMVHQTYLREILHLDASLDDTLFSSCPLVLRPQRPTAHLLTRDCRPILLYCLIA